MAEFECGKLFVGGVSWDTTEATLTDHFRRYGEVSSSTIAVDRSTGNPRGFAFVTFSDPSSADRALNDLHEISGRTVEVKKAKRRGEQPNYHQSYRKSISSTTSTEFDRQFRSKKIFVGGLSANLTEEEFKNYFKKFGRITDVVVMYDNVTNRPRGFGFITFDSEDVVEKIMRNSFHELGGKYVEVKRAIPREASRNASNGQNLSTDVERASPCGGYWPDNVNVHSGFYPSHGCVPAYGYGGVYGAGYQMAWPGYGSVGYGMPVVPGSGHWNGLGMVSYGHLPYGPSSVYNMNLVSDAGSFGAYNSVDNSVGILKLVPDGGSNRDVQDNSSTRATEGLRSNCNGSSLKARQGAINNRGRKDKDHLTGNRSCSYQETEADYSAALDS